MHIDKSTYSPQNTGKFMVVGGMVRGVIDNSLFNAGNEIAWIHFVNGEGAGNGEQRGRSPRDLVQLISCMSRTAAF